MFARYTASPRPCRSANRHTVEPIGVAFAPLPGSDGSGTCAHGLGKLPHAAHVAGGTAVPTGCALEMFGYRGSPDLVELYTHPAPLVPTSCPSTKIRLFPCRYESAEIAIRIHRSGPTRPVAVSPDGSAAYPMY